MAGNVVDCLTFAFPASHLKVRLRGNSSGMCQLMHYHLRQPFDCHFAGRDNAGAPAAQACAVERSGAASRDLERNYR